MLGGSSCFVITAFPPLQPHPFLAVRARASASPQAEGSSPELALWARSQWGTLAPVWPGAWGGAQGGRGVKVQPRVREVGLSCGTNPPRIQERQLRGRPRRPPRVWAAGEGLQAPGLAPAPPL